MRKSEKSTRSIRSIRSLLFAAALLLFLAAAARALVDPNDPNEGLDTLVPYPLVGHEDYDDLWGILLKRVLRVEHNNDGTHKPLNQDTTGSARYWKTAATGRAAIAGPNVAATRTYTFPDADATILYQVAPLSVYGAGTAYTVTASQAAIDLGTTDPNLTLTTAGVWLVRYRVQWDWASATAAAEKTLTLKLVRRNNTPATLDTQTYTLPILSSATNATAGTDTVDFVYTTANSDDQLGLDVQLSATPDAGSLQVVKARIVATWTGP